jgi:hypothetical protein
VNTRSFGRRPGPQTQRPLPPAAAPFQRKIAVFDEATVEPAQPIVAPPEDPSPSVDDELRQWKKSRKGFTIPWRQVSLMASLCFGAASLVLPASVNHNVDYLLYALMGMSLYVGISKRLKI